jgi:hypothetical protein
MFSKNQDERFVQHQSLHPTSIVLVNKEQVLAFQNERSYRILSIDETQGIVNLPEKSTEHRNQAIGLFTLMLQRKDCSSLPVGQFLTNSRKSYVIQHFLNIWRDLVGSQLKINEIVMDQDFAEAEATCIAFNGFNLITYNSLALKYVLSQRNKFENTLIRFDRNHITKSFVTLTKNLRLNKVFNSTLCLLVDEANFNNIVAAFGCLIALASSTDQTELINDCYHWLKSFKSSAEDLPNAPFLLENMSEKWFSEMVNLIKEVTESQHDELQRTENRFYNPQALKMLERYSSRVLMWTAVIPKMVKSRKIEASTAANENFHRVIKNSLFKDVGLPCEIQTFVERMESSIKAMVLPEKKFMKANLLNTSNENSMQAISLNTNTPADDSFRVNSLNSGQNSSLNLNSTCAETSIENDLFGKSNISF